MKPPWKRWRRKPRKRPGGPLGRLLAMHDLSEAMRRVQERDDEQERTDQEGRQP